jgi:hypothetical protein
MELSQYMITRSDWMGKKLVYHYYPFDTNGDLMLNRKQKFAGHYRMDTDGEMVGDEMLVEEPRRDDDFKRL